MIVAAGLSASALTGCAGPAQSPDAVTAEEPEAVAITGRLVPPSKPLPEPQPTRLIPPTDSSTATKNPAVGNALQAPVSQGGLTDYDLLDTPPSATSLFDTPTTAQSAPAVSNELIVADIKPEPQTDIAGVPTVAAATPALNTSQSAIPRQSFEQLLALANAGDTDAQFQLATAYARGDDELRVEKNATEAYYWYQRAAAQGDSTAQYRLGLMHFRGSAVPKDYVIAREWWLEAATLGNADAQQKLGYLYSEALGVERDYKRAVSWYTRAARLGHAEAQTLLGSLYHEGDRIPQNYDEAFKWYKLAAERGHPHAQYTLATLYHDGFGTEQDFVQCTAWVDVAVANGYFDEFDARRECSQHLDENELKRAATLAKRWQTSHPKLVEYN